MRTTSSYCSPDVGADGGSCCALSPCALSAVMNMLNFGILAIDRDGRIIFANRAAEALLQPRKGLTVHSNGQGTGALLAAGVLAQRVKAAISGNESHVERCFFLPAASYASLIVLIALCDSKPEGPANEPTAIVFVSDPTATPNMDLRPIARLYELTRAETQLLEALLKGSRVGEYAKRANITLNTAKAYLKQLFGKTRTGRQSDLVRLVLANPILHLISTPEISSSRGRRR
jgi:DNA-binding CsgD family transcriptional regulator